MTRQQKLSTAARPSVHRRRGIKRSGIRRSGAILVWFALMLTMLLGMVGLVVDSGLLMAGHRHTQNAADAAALAAALDLMLGKSPAVATATAITFCKQHNDLADAPDPIVNIPPASGPYAGEPGYVEVIASNPLPTYFIQVLPGVATENTVRARAVAGSQAIAAGEGVIVLDPTKTGLKISGQAILKVLGDVYVNSEGRGKDADGNDIGIDENYYASRVSNNAEAYASKFHIVGGVDWPTNYQYIGPGDIPLDELLLTGQIPMPDPLLYLPTPTVETGVDPTYRGYPQATNTNLKLNDAEADLTSPANYVDDSDPDPSNHVMVLHPGIYRSISITGGNVDFKPGIYVIRPEENTQNAFTVTGGNVDARGIMIYNTGSNYDEVSGDPDRLDQNQAPPHPDGAEFGGITINAGIKLAGIDLEDPALDYDPMHRPSQIFDGMLLYQRRRNTMDVNIQGDATDGALSGTLYAKWAETKIAGQGIYNAQFVVGTMDLTGSGVVTIDYTGEKLGKAPQVFLVE